MIDVILIAGLGPAHLEAEDLKYSYMDLSISNSERDAAYQIGARNFNPLQFSYTDSYGSRIPILRENNVTPPTLIETTLRNILDSGNIQYQFLKASNVWNNINLQEKCKIVCLSTSFMWSEYMIDYAIAWIDSHICYDFLILGGQYASLKQNFIMNNYKNVDFLITGDAELSLVPLIHEIQSGNCNYVHIPNLLYRTNVGVITTQDELGDINQYATPSYEGEHDIIPYISMKGCIYGCKFCALRHCSKKWQYRTADKIVEDWKLFAQKNNAKHIDVNDSTFFIPYRKIEQLLPMLKDINVTWEANARADTPFREKDIEALESVGCKALFFGFESMSDVTLGYMDKQTTSFLNRKINKMFCDSQIDTMMSFIIGFPGETPTEFQKTREYLLMEHYGHFNIYVFEFEDKSMPIWKDRDKFQIEVYKDVESGFFWKHGGLNWKHCGMDSNTAYSLRNTLLRDIRKSNKTKAIHKSWQYAFEFPFIPERNRQENLKIEQLFDKLMYIALDYPDLEERKTVLKHIVKELKEMGIE